MDINKTGKIVAIILTVVLVMGFGINKIKIKSFPIGTMTFSLRFDKTYPLEDIQEIRGSKWNLSITTTPDGFVRAVLIPNDWKVSDGRFLKRFEDEKLIPKCQIVGRVYVHPTGHEDVLIETFVPPRPLEGNRLLIFSRHLGEDKRRFPTRKAPAHFTGSSFHGLQLEISF